MWDIQIKNCSSSRVWNVSIARVTSTSAACANCSFSARFVKYAMHSSGATFVKYAMHSSGATFVKYAMQSSGLLL